MLIYFCPSRVILSSSYYCCFYDLVLTFVQLSAFFSTCSSPLSYSVFYMILKSNLFFYAFLLFFQHFMCSLSIGRSMPLKMGYSIWFLLTKLMLFYLNRAFALLLLIWIQKIDFFLVFYPKSHIYHQLPSKSWLY